MKVASALGINLLKRYNSSFGHTYQSFATTDFSLQAAVLSVLQFLKKKCAFFFFFHPQNPTRKTAHI